MSELIALNDYVTKEGKIIEEFLQSKKLKNKNTYLAYSTDIKQLIEGLFTNKSIYNVTKRELNSINLSKLTSYFSELYELAKSKKIRCSNNTLNRKQSTAKEFIRYLKARNVIETEISYLDLIESFPDDSESIEYMPLDIAKQYAEHIRKFEKHKAEEKYRLVLLAIDSGLRLSEILSIRWNDFIEEDGFVLIRGRGKGNKKWIEKISYELYNLILEIKSGNNDKVFTLTPKNVTDMMKRTKKALRHDNRNYSFHSFRKTAVTFTRRITGSVREAQRKGRHSNVATTEIYLAEEEYPMTGAISLGQGLNHNLYREVSHKELIEALSEMNKDTLFALNMKLVLNRKEN
ncbi:tyrosine-type recombinase/integrase [Siminovitchia sp. 179-K 8D1 HS]|uniref:tyrosine-type recombinase/integrase n=1 Tax=Siminovitchia sp. 179-K 8D1 HS TaxID=3142385 RepID=UPI0039A10421